MARQLFTNHAFSTLAGNILAGDVSLAVQAGDGALFPALTGGNWFICTLVDASNNKEIVKVTARTTDTFTIVRAQEGTSARGYTSGDRVALRVTANALALLAPLADPTFTGTAAAPTPASPTDDTTKIATTAWVNAAIAAIPAPPAPPTPPDANSLAKAWFEYDGFASSLLAGYNVASVTKNGVGDYTVNFTTPFTTANFAASVSVHGGTVSARANVVYIVAQAAGTLQIKCGTTGDSYGAGGQADLTVSGVCFGAQ